MHSIFLVWMRVKGILIFINVSLICSNNALIINSCFIYFFTSKFFKKSLLEKILYDNLKNLAEYFNKFLTPNI